jgi:lipopolysaccharide export LptBFGC system permease protein LptF
MANSPRIFAGNLFTLDMNPRDGRHFRIPNTKTSLTNTKLFPGMQRKMRRSESAPRTSGIRTIPYYIRTRNIYKRQKSLTGKRQNRFCFLFFCLFLVFTYPKHVVVYKRSVSTATTFSPLTSHCHIVISLNL